MTDLEDQLVTQIVDFLDGIGIVVRSASFSEPTFLPGLKIERGEILLDESRLLYPGDLLHEAGHIAVVPKAERATLTEPLEWPESTAGGYEMAAIAWSYAAVVNLKLDVRIIFHEDGYKGDSANIIQNFTTGHYIGVPILQWAEMTLDERSAETTGSKPYPVMLKWMR